MNTEIRARTRPGEVAAVAVVDGRLLDVAIERPGAPDGVGDLHRGRITARVRAMAGAFVALAGGVEGFLPDRQGAAGCGEGDAVVVRVTRAAQGGKGLRLARAEGEAAGPPALLGRGPGAVERLAALHPAAPVTVDDPALAARLAPLLAGRIRFAPAAWEPAIAEEFAALFEPEVALDGGARLSITPTPALTAIDVDLGARVAGREGARAAHLAANRALLPELARQIRLRHLGGAILVDFAGLALRGRAALAAPLAAALATDPLTPRLLGFTALGLAEILRPRVHPPLHERARGPHAAALAGLAALEAACRAPAATAGPAPVLSAAPAVAAALAADAAANAEFRARNTIAPAWRSAAGLTGLGWRIDHG